MAAHAGKGAAVAHCAALFHDSLRRMFVLEIRIVVVRRLQAGPLGIVALRATERRIDLIVTDQAVSHQRHIGVAHMIRGIDATMAGQARIGRIEMGAEVIRIGDVGLVIDGGDYGRRYGVPQFQVLGVTEMSERGRAGRPYGPAIVTRSTNRDGRQQVVRNRSTGGDGSVTVGALLLQLQMQLVRERRWLRVQAYSQQHEEGGWKPSPR
jgi:hypothetical protein